MAKSRSTFVCQNCGAVTNRWQGRCDSCHEWNSIVEEDAGPPTAIRAHRGRAFALEGLSGEGHAAPRIVTGIAEFDRVTGGGFVHGSVTLLGGEPGIGKSTLLIQACAALARRGARVIYISGEEAVAQVRLRAARLDLADASVELASATQVEDILATCSTGKRAALIVIDSIQTMHTETVESSPGTV
ncbi:MAG TPA: ATPase domain-containing protein, partial [Methylocystis sp.]